MSRLAIHPHYIFSEFEFLLDLPWCGCQLIFSRFNIVYAEKYENFKAEKCDEHCYEEITVGRVL